MSLSEFELIRKFFKPAERPSHGIRCGIGDDAAIVSVPKNFELAISTDTLVSGIHFPETTSAEDIGYKALAVNLSDLAAMGASPVWATLALTLPNADETWLQGFMSGFNTLAEHYNLSLIGGDLTHGPLSVTVQIMGFLPKGSGLLRSGAKDSDLIYVTGTLGDAGLALKELKQDIKIDSTHIDYLSQRLNRPTPRIELGKLLHNIANSVIDISDGLLADLDHILEESGAGAFIQTKDIPLSDALTSLDRETALQLAFSSGDDYELCFTVPEENREKLEKVSAGICRISCIGRISSPGEGIEIKDNAGRQVKLSAKGYRHF